MERHLLNLFHLHLQFRRAQRPKLQTKSLKVEQPSSTSLTIFFSCKTMMVSLLSIGLKFLTLSDYDLFDSLKTTKQFSLLRKTANFAPLLCFEDKHQAENKDFCNKKSESKSICCYWKTEQKIVDRKEEQLLLSLKILLNDSNQFHHFRITSTFRVVKLNHPKNRPLFIKSHNDYPNGF